jgi:hypothetical protein
VLVPFFHHRQGDEDGHDSFLFVDGSRPEQRLDHPEPEHVWAVLEPGL